MKKHRLVLQTLLLLICVWVGVFAIHSRTSHHRITAELLSQKIIESDLAKLSAENRSQKIQEITQIFNNLEPEEREKVHQSDDIQKFFLQLSPAEQADFFSATIGDTMKNFLLAVDAMQPSDREKLLSNSLKRMASQGTAYKFPDLSTLPADINELITKDGLRAYFENVDTAAKLSLIPLIDQMDSNLKGFHGRPKSTK